MFLKISLLPSSKSVKFIRALGLYLTISIKLLLGLKRLFGPLLLILLTSKRKLELETDSQNSQISNQIPNSQIRILNPNSNPILTDALQIGNINPSPLTKNKRLTLLNFSTYLLTTRTILTTLSPSKFLTTFRFLINPCDSVEKQVEEIITTDTMQITRNKIYCINRSVNGAPILCKLNKTSATLITEINEDSSSN